MEQSNGILSLERVNLSELPPEVGTLVIEANSRKYGLSSNLVLRLETGEWALFNRKFELLAIAQQFASLEELAAQTCAPPTTTQKTKRKITEINLEDLGL